MKKDIHPENYTETTFKCSCGETFTVYSCSAAKEQRIDVCSKCHPFFTGEMKFMDTAGRIDKFKKKYGDE
jgi:large subunit ribosomal protein L31